MNDITSYDAHNLTQTGASERKRNEIKKLNNRAINLINYNINQLGLDLRGLTVLTEVGSGVYKYLPVIAALAGAEQVFAWTRDSAYGRGDHIVKDCQLMLNEINSLETVKFSINSRPLSEIAEADIITNSGFLRPLNSEFLRHLKPGAVIPLMFEAWEIRESDIDIEYCRHNKIKVAGTNESHPLIRVFDYVGILALKLAFEAEMEVLDNNIIVWSDDYFGEMASKTFVDLGARQVIVTTDIDEVYEKVKHCDFVFIADYSATEPLIARDGLFDLSKIKAINPSVTFVHLYGDIDADFAVENGIKLYPEKKGRPQVMTETLGYVGLKPIIALQTAGLKVAQEMMSGDISKLSQPISF